MSDRSSRSTTGLDGIAAALIPIARAVHADWPAINNELHLVGYSKLYKGFAMVRLRSKHNFEPEELSTGAHFSGVNRELPTSIDPPSVGKWISCALGLKKQCGADSWIGGDLVLHTLTPGGISIEKIHRFSDYDTTLQMIEDRWTRNKTPSPSSSDTAMNLRELVSF